MSISVKKILRKTGKVLLWIVGIIVFLVVLLYILIQVPAVQNFAKNKVVAYLEKKIGTKVSIDHLSLKMTKRVMMWYFIWAISIHALRRSTLLIPFMKFQPSTFPVYGAR